MDAQELATRLVGSGKPISGERLQKLARHLTSKAQLDDVLSYLRSDERAAVEAGIEPFVRKLV